jgi:hypothetical protein
MLASQIVGGVRRAAPCLGTARHRQPLSTCSPRSPRKALPGALPAEALQLAVTAAAADAPAFAPQAPGSAVFVAALCAAVPPVVYWSQVVLRERKRIQDTRDKEQAREVGVKAARCVACSSLQPVFTFSY